MLEIQIDIYKNNNDPAGLAEANMAYGVFLRSYSIDKWNKVYTERGFIEKEVTYNNRYTKSIEYLNKSKKYYETNEKFDGLSNIYLHIGWSYWASDKITEGCNSFRQSIKANKVFMERNPDAKIALGGFPSFEAYANDQMSKAKCPSV